MKKILFVMPRLPFPATSGRKTSLYNYCKILKNLGYELVVASFLEQGDDILLKPSFIDKLVVLPKVSGKEKVFNLISKTLIARKFPMQVSLYWSKEVKKVIDTLINNEKPDIVIADMIRTTEYLKSVKCFKIADLDDMLSIRYKRQLEVDLDGVNPYGAYLTSLPKIVQKLLLKTYIKKIILKQEITLIEKYELSMGKCFDSVVLVAQREAEIFNNILGQQKAVDVPIGVDIEYFSESLEQIEIDNNKIGFLGALNVAHNENAVIHFIENIFPIILERNPNAQFVVIGGGITDRLKKYSSANIIFTGRVDDVREYIKQCRVFVCPLTFGSGIKTKNLEAMASGIPVVTTSIGAENIDAVDGQEYLVQDSNEGFANAITKLLQDEEYCKVIGVNGKRFIKNHFTWKIAFEQWKYILESCGER